MKKGVFFSVVVVLLGLLCSGSSHAITITIGFTPVTQQVSLGAQAVVDLFISGLGDFAAPSLGAFDLDVTFDPGILSFSSAAYGDPVLGDQLVLSGVGSLKQTTPGAGSVNLFEISLDSQSDLDALQAGNFTLATLTFDTLAFGTSPLNVAINSLEDALGKPLFAEIQNGSVSAVPGAVPEPSTFLLLGVGFAGVGIMRRKLRK